MSLRTRYQAFLRHPTATSLAEGVSLHYIPTLTSIHDTQKVIAQLTSQSLKRREEKFIDVVEGNQALVVEVETTLEFVSGGGAYLPGLDDNFLADRTVTTLIVHVVHFDHEQKIGQIRLHWDQAALLKDVDVIGARSKGWPIKPGQEQARLVTTMASGSFKAESRPPSSSNASVSNMSVASTQYSNGESKRRIKDPHSSLSLFEPIQSSPETPRPVSLPMRSSAKPPARDYGDLFVGGDADTPQPPHPRGGSFAGGPPSAEKKSPMKAGGGKNYQPSRLFDEDDSITQQVPTKAGSSKNYEPSRLFDEDDSVQQPVAAKVGSSKNFQPSRLFDENEKTPDKSKPSTKPNPKKYEHFDFGEGAGETAAAPKPASPIKNRTSKHISQWNFEDFVTPEKPVQRTRGQDVRHFGWSDDEVEDTPAQPKKALQPRKDADTHFEFVDDGTPKGDEKRPPMRPKGVSHNEGLGLYQNNVVREEGTSSPAKKNNNNMPLGNVTNMNNHRKNFGSHFIMADNSPSSGSGSNKQTENKKPTSSQGHEAAIKMMDSDWDRFDEGGKKKDGDDDDNNTRTKVMGKDHEEMKKENGGPDETQNKRFSTTIKTAGDGMGGKNGLRRQWGIGDESGDEEEQSRKPKPKNDSRHMTSSATGEKSFWDF
ncbi:MAG: hypothetical protein M1823_005330 [Watsoniomyces obsoletus]|nr:MAG: hypothetical protein M1823_005330 [Watsoniomyces obsoletus]